MYTYEKSMDLFTRATKVIPSGIYGHESPALVVPGSFPYYVAKGQGSRYWDIDGNEFIDYMCAYGPMVVGHNNPVVEKAAQEQREKGNCHNHPSERMVELAELMVELIPIADWAVFAKNGSDVTTWATMVAREHTHRKKILMVAGTYHGTHAWCTPGHGGLIPEDRANIHTFKWNDVDSFHKAIEKYKGQVAGVIMTPYHHPAFGDSILPAPGWWETIEKTCKQEDIVLILDDVRAGFRLNLGGSNEYFGFKPDIICFCKAIGNGNPISSAVGKDFLKGAAGKVFLTGSYWNNSVPMAAALATIKLLRETDGIGTMMKMGKRLMDGLVDLAKTHGLQVTASGPYTIPFLSFANETNFLRNQLFCSEVTKRGSYFHPHHNWFLSSAHTEQDIDETLKHADAAYKLVKQEFGS